MYDSVVLLLFYLSRVGNLDPPGVNGRLPVGDKLSVLVLRNKTMYRTDFDAKITVAALKSADFPLFSVFGHGNCISGAAFSANTAKNTPINIILDVPARDWSEHSLLLGIHEGGRTRKQVLCKRLSHQESLHRLSSGNNPFHQFQSFEPFQAF